MPMQIKDLTIDELKTVIRQTVVETLDEYLDDPDEGLELREEVKLRLAQSLNKTQAGERGIPAEEVAKKLGLNW